MALVSYALLSLLAFPLIGVNCSPLNVKNDPGQPLFLTPYIMSGQIRKARLLSTVDSLIPNKLIPSYSGFITVNQTTNASMFFWYFPTTRDNAPLIVWLQGGPGTTSLFGMFTEIGPYFMYDNGTLGYRANLPWNFYYNIVYIDNPVGTGYSFVGAKSDYRVDQAGVADHLFIFLQQFVKLFPEVVAPGLYIAGESYAGKYVPSFGYRVFKEMQAGNSPIPLKGLLIGNGLSDPETMIPMIGEHLYTLGLMNYPQLLEARSLATECVENIQAKNWTRAYELFNTLILHGVLVHYPSLYQNSSGCYAYYDFIKLCNHMPPWYSNYQPFVTSDAIRAKLHVGNLTFNNVSLTVKNYLVDDVPQTVRPLVEEMLNSTKVKVLYYSGMKDLIVPTHATDTYIRKLNWYGASTFQQASLNRTIWTRPGKIGGQHVNGYVTQAANLTFVVVRNASHMVPHDQPLEAFDMVFRFIENQPFSDFYLDIPLPWK